MDISTIVLGLFAAIVFGFTAACVIRFCAVVRESKAESDAIDKWWKDRAEARKKQNDCGRDAA